MSNPAFNNSPVFTTKAVVNSTTVNGKTMTPSELDELYGRPSATPTDTDRMTYEDTIVKIVIAFGILLAGAVVGWIVPVLAIPGAIIGLVLALVNIFKKKPSRGLILAYAAFEGLFVGGISAIFEQAYGGIVPQAVFGTLGVVGVTLALFATGKVRESKRATQIFTVAIFGYMAFQLVNLVLVWTGVLPTFGVQSMHPLINLGIGLLVVLLASYSLVMDFTSIKRGVEGGAPRIFGWTAAFGIMVTVVWLYTEILRFLAIFRQ
ncbi:putative YccA/Bax inhibitor family protein [Conyzicola nivalis]|uniref:YccA/Bax inhibitor family protein n=1 Tax=Conyzicola nivalis TaxID=1477021 RepID=A0ABV2QNV9_9MICO